MVAPAHMGRRMWMGCIWVVDSIALASGLAIGVVHREVVRSRLASGSSFWN